MAIATGVATRTGELPRQSGAFAVDVIDSETLSSRLRASGVLGRQGGEMLEALLIAQQESGVRYVRLDVSRVRAVDVEGMRALVNAHRRFLAARGTLVLTAVGPLLEQAFARAHVDTVLLTVEPPAVEGESAYRRAG